MKSKIKVTFFSNFLLHHQTPFCEAMTKRLGDNFRFVATEPTDTERLNMGYRDYTDVPYVVYSYKDDKQYKEALRLGRDSDVVIIGSAPLEFIKDRLTQNKLTFRYCERFFKEGKWRILDPRVLYCNYTQHFKYRNKNLYMLCASAYTAPDCRFILSYPNKTYKWGYFPETELFFYDELLKKKSSGGKVKILWAGRMINWKHPESAVELALRLKAKGISFFLDMIGDGDMYTAINDLINKNDLIEDVKLLGTMPPEAVRRHMQTSDIFLFTSDRNEGWGAVLNESMSAGCAVVANREIGSVPYLIENGKNGLVYDQRDKNSLYRCVMKLIDNKQLRKRLGKNAYDTIKTVWNAEIAADRLLTLIECINNGTPVPFTSGPCSKD